MIVWLASYPRSGNTLLRTVLFRTMGLCSTADEDPPARRLDQEAIGAFIRPQPWSEYYHTALAAQELFLIKTHRPPRDGNPAIYVVRDGRKACLSYDYLHTAYLPPTRPSLLDKILGDDVYGSWSEHVHQWAGRENTLLVRYEELVNASAELLERLAAHIGYCGAIQPWSNPFEEFSQSHPDFFRQGKIDWQGDPKWQTWIDSVFFHLHGELMIELGYASPESVSAARANFPAEFLPLIGKCGSLIAEKYDLNRVCSERMQVIDGLKQACDERLSLIEQLHEQAAAATSHPQVIDRARTLADDPGQ